MPARKGEETCSTNHSSLPPLTTRRSSAPRGSQVPVVPVQRLAADLVLGDEVGGLGEVVPPVLRGGAERLEHRELGRLVGEVRVVSPADHEQGGPHPGHEVEGVVLWLVVGVRESTDVRTAASIREVPPGRCRGASWTARPDRSDPRTAPWLPRRRAHGHPRRRGASSARGSGSLRPRRTGRTRRSSPRGGPGGSRRRRPRRP